MTAAVALLLAILIWASNSVMVKLVLREVSPLFAWALLAEPIISAVLVCGLVIASGVYLLNRT